MLDALKFAFEILIVGALSLPWLAILNQMFEDVGPSATLPAYFKFIPDAAQTTVVVAVVIAFGYVTGSVISRASRDLFNDELLRPLPTEDLIRVAVYQSEYCGQDQMNVNENAPELGQVTVVSDDSPLFEDSEGERPSAKITVAIKHQHSLHEKYRNAFCPVIESGHGRIDRGTAEKLEQHIKSMFRLQEGELLLLGDDKVARLKGYYDQITVLRGAAFNGFVLLIICVIGGCANWRVKAGLTRSLSQLAYVPSAAMFLLGLYELGGHYAHMRAEASLLYHSVPTHFQILEALYNDPPLAEFVLILLGGVGFLVIRHAKKVTPYLRTGIVAAIFTFVCLGSWWWTEVMYDEQVVHSQVELRPNPLTPVHIEPTGGVHIDE